MRLFDIRGSIIEALQGAIVAVALFGVFPNWAATVEIVSPALVFKKGPKGVEKLGQAKVGQKFAFIAKAGKGKYYKIKVKGQEAYVAVGAAKLLGADDEMDEAGVPDSGGDKSSQKASSGGLQFEFGLQRQVARAGAAGLGFDGALFYAIPMSPSLSVDIGGISFAYLFSAGGVKIFGFGGAARLSLHAGSIVISPELSYVVTIAKTSLGSASGSDFGAGVFFGIPLGQSLALAPGARFGFSDGLSSTAVLNARMMF